jgi:hypothetical protein
MQMELMGPPLWTGFVGSNATELCHPGCRLTIGADSPRDYDLAEEPQPKVD